MVPKARINAIALQIPDRGETPNRTRRPAPGPSPACAMRVSGAGEAGELREKLGTTVFSFLSFYV
jgi:hypothetical protein